MKIRSFDELSPEVREAFAWKAEQILGDVVVAGEIAPNADFDAEVKKIKNEMLTYDQANIAAIVAEHKAYKSDLWSHQLRKSEPHRSR